MNEQTTEQAAPDSTGSPQFTPDWTPPAVDATVDRFQPAVSATAALPPETAEDRRQNCRETPLYQAMQISDLGFVVIPKDASGLPESLNIDPAEELDGIIKTARRIYLEEQKQPGGPIDHVDKVDSGLWLSYLSRAAQQKLSAKLTAANGKNTPTPATRQAGQFYYELVELAVLRGQDFFGNRLNSPPSTTSTPPDSASPDSMPTSP